MHQLAALHNLLKNGVSHDNTAIKWVKHSAVQCSNNFLEQDTVRFFNNGSFQIK